MSSPVRISSAVTRGVYRGNRAPCHGLAVHRLPSRELRSSPSSSALLPRRHYLKDFPWRQDSHRSLTQSCPSRNPDAIYRWPVRSQNAAAPVRSSTRRAMSSAKPSLERLPPCWRDSPPSNGRVDDASPLGVGDLPDYSMFQESAPRTLVIGEEHFTFLGYHSERRCQGPL